MSCDPATPRLRNLMAGQTYEVTVHGFVDEDGNKLDITGRAYLLTLKKSLTLTDAQATGADGFQVRVTATTQDNTADRIVLTMPPSASSQLSGDYFADVTEIAPGTPPKVTPVIPVQTITVSLPATRSVT